MPYLEAASSMAPFTPFMWISRNLNIFRRTPLFVKTDNNTRDKRRHERGKEITKHQQQKRQKQTKLKEMGHMSWKLLSFNTHIYSMKSIRNSYKI